MYHGPWGTSPVPLHFIDIVLLMGLLAQQNYIIIFRALLPTPRTVVQIHSLYHTQKHLFWFVSFYVVSCDSHWVEVVIWDSEIWSTNDGERVQVVFGGILERKRRHMAMKNDDDSTLKLRDPKIILKTINNLFLVLVQSKPLLFISKII